MEPSRTFVVSSRGGKLLRRPPNQQSRGRNPRLKKRRRTQTPKEQPDDRDEDAYTDDEAHVSKCRDLDDGSYKEGSSECA